jgi:integrative and conjugative element protein (TIGR02256 family)
MLRVEIDGKQIFITDSVLNIFYEFRQPDKRQGERGGVLLGQVTEDEHRILVSRASIPGNQDKASRFSFYRDRKMAQQIVEYEFHNSDGKNTYLGEWHTHPTNKASPSSQDVSMIADQLSNNHMKVGFILLFVLARENFFNCYSRLCHKNLT